MGLLVTVAYTSLAFGGWTGVNGDQLMSYFPGPSDFLCNGVIIVPGDNGTLYSVWAQGKTFVPYEIFFSKSTDNGRTWSGTAADQRISADDGEGILGPTATRPTGLCLNSQGDIFVVWAESLTNVGYEVMMVKSTDGGATWIHSDTDFPISFQGGPRTYEPKIVADHDDNLHAVWHQRTPADTSEIFYGFSSDGGDTWTSQSADRWISFPDGFHASSPDITVDPDNNVLVVWQEKTGVEVDSLAVHFGEKLSGQSEFSSETQDIQISMGHRSTVTPSIAVARDRSIHVAWEARNNINGSFKGAIYYTRSTDGGSTWTGIDTEMPIDTSPMDDTSATNPTIVVTSTGKLAVSYCHFDLSSNGHTVVYLVYSFDSGDTWSTAPDIVGHWEPTGDDRPSYTPYICVSAGDTLHVVWKEDCDDIGGSSGYYEAMYSRGDTLGTSGQPGCEYVPGDINNNGFANGVDVSYGVNYFKGFGPPPPLTCPDCPEPGQELYAAGDVNGNCIFNGVDITYFVSYLRGGGADLLYCPNCPPAR